MGGNSPGPTWLNGGIDVEHPGIVQGLAHSMHLASAEAYAQQLLLRMVSISVGNVLNDDLNWLDGYATHVPTAQISPDKPSPPPAQSPPHP